LIRSAALVCAIVSLFAIQGLGQQLSPVARKHVRTIISSGQAVQVETLPATQQMHIGIMLPLRNQDALTSLLRRLYDPSSPDYRHFLTVQQFTDQFGPTADDYQTVINFARANGMNVISTFGNRLLVDVTGSVAQIEAAFHVSMNVYQHPTEDRTFFSPDREPTVNLPVTLWAIAGLDNYSIPRPATSIVPQGQAISNAGGSSQPGGYFLPSDMRAAYYGGTALTGSGQTVGLLEFDGYYVDDLISNFNGAASYTANGNNYTLTYTTGGVPYTIPINNVLLDNASLTPVTTGQHHIDWEGEVVLDIAQPIGMAPGLNQVLVYIAPDPTTYPGSDGDLLEHMVNDDIAMQLSCSWTWDPTDASRNETYLETMATLGQSFFAASGDSGAWSYGATTYPPSDAWVTSVGGTDLTTNGAGGSWAAETAWSGSGGGISGVSIPSYQSGLNGVNGASTTLRNVPDVAAEANADNYNCAFGSCGAWYGTSFAAPRWAGYMALANQQAVAAGIVQQGTGLGFINQTVPGTYSIGKSPYYSYDFHDIQSGSNGAYSTGAGYDLVTGWGSPNGASLISALASPPIVGTLSNTSDTVDQHIGNCIILTTTYASLVSGLIDAVIL
jgi:subtilase family serine protease